MSPPLRVLVTGGRGQLGRDLRDVLAGSVPDGGADADGPEGRGMLADRGQGGVRGPGHRASTQLDVVDRTAVREAVDGFRPDIVLHGGAYTAVDACESDPDTAFAVNALGTRNMAEAAVGVGRPPGLRLDRLRLRRHPRPALRRVGPAQPPIGLRAEQARRGARGPQRGRAVGHRGPHGVGERGPRRQHGQDGAPPGRGQPRRPAALRRRPARLPDLHRRPGPGRGPAGPRPPARDVPRHQPG